MDAARRSQLVAMEEEQKHDDAQPAPPPPPQPSAPTLASCLALLAGASDEHKVAGLLLLARQDGAALASVAAWTEKVVGSKRNWNGLCSSSDGAKLVGKHEFPALGHLMA